MNNISIIVAIGKNNEIGYKNNLLWRISDDLKRFKKFTTNNTVIMGRKTFDSLPKGALPNRENIVITRNSNLKYENCIMANSINDAIEKSSDNNELFIIGGEEIYKLAYPICIKLYLTKIDEEFSADAFFPNIDYTKWEVIYSEKIKKTEKNEYSHQFFEMIKTHL
jgi:dihydrofolate reductase